MGEESLKAIKTSHHTTSAILTLSTGAGILHTKCEQVKEITPAVHALAQRLEDYLKTHQHDDPRPIGISAPQLGKSICMFSYVTDMDDNILTVINPELVYEKKKKHFVVETCLSIPGQKFTLKRGKIVKIRGMFIDGTHCSLKGHGLLAQVFLHELNHLDGITIDTIRGRTV